MKNKTYEIKINLPKKQVWDIMLGKETYPQWVKGFSENSDMVGEWKQGTQVDFLDVNRGGTRAILDIVDEPNRLLARHAAVLDKDGNPQTEGMDNWIGTTEEWVLTEDDGVTALTINMHYDKDFENMLDEGWDKSLNLLKELCEKSNF